MKLHSVYPQIDGTERFVWSTPHGNVYVNVRISKPSNAISESGTTLGYQYEEKRYKRDIAEAKRKTLDEVNHS